MEVTERCQQIVFFKKRQIREVPGGRLGLDAGQLCAPGGVLWEVPTAAWPRNHLVTADLEESRVADSARIPFSCFLFPKTEITGEGREKSLFEIEREFLCHQLH